ncbi:hypothetical protein ABTX77_26880 [Streptomyces sp. NPDC097704]|uniref:hypothetical protein n=1 Tax=Streptomyces sp. NPDC097704 TaxID=3157101 RepID=UPI0033227ADD
MTFRDVDGAFDSGVDVVACGMQNLTFLDVVGLHAVLDPARRLDARGITFFAYDRQRQPRRLLGLIEELPPAADIRVKAGEPVPSPV